MIVLIPSRVAYKTFIRTCTAAIAKAFCRNSIEGVQRLFEFRPFTRVLEWGRDYRNVMEYHDLNDLEARGYLRRPAKKNKPLHADRKARNSV